MAVRVVKPRAVVHHVAVGISGPRCDVAEHRSPPGWHGIGGRVLIGELDQSSQPPLEQREVVVGVVAEGLEGVLRAVGGRKVPDAVDLKSIGKAHLGGPAEQRKHRFRQHRRVRRANRVEAEVVHDPWAVPNHRCPLAPHRGDDAFHVVRARPTDATDAIPVPRGVRREFCRVRRHQTDKRLRQREPVCRAERPTLQLHVQVKPVVQPRRRLEPRAHQVERRTTRPDR